MKKIYVLVIMFLCFCTLSACKDYGYEYHFSVIGENGTISAIWGEKTYNSDESPVVLMGGKRGGHRLKLVAIPAEGYQVKEWIYNGKIVEGNKTNSLVTASVDYKHTIITISVVFELIY